MGNPCTAMNQRNSQDMSSSEHSLMKASWIKDGGYLFLAAFRRETTEQSYSRTQSTYNRNWKRLAPTLKKKTEESPSLYHPELRKQWKHYIRSGVPDKLARSVILKLFSIKGSDIEYHPLLMEVFSGKIPETFTLVPTFSTATSIEKILSRYYINSVGEAALKRILWVIHNYHPFVKFCPQIVGALSLLLVYLNENEAYALITKLLINSRQEKETSFKRHFTCTKREHSILVQETSNLIRRDMRGLATFLDSQNFDLNKLISDMLNCFFVGYFRISCLLRILLCFLCEGNKTLIRVIYGVFNILQRELPYRQEQIEVYIKNQCCSLTSCDDLLRTGFRALISRQDFISEQPEPESVSEHIAGLFRLSIQLQSNIMSVCHFDLIWSHLPANFRILAPKFILSSQECGVTLRELENRSSLYPPSTPMLFLAQTKTGETLGAFIDCTIQSNKKSSQMVNSFVFQLEPEPRFYHSSESEAWINFSKDELSFGKNEHDIAFSIDSGFETCSFHSSKTYGTTNIGSQVFQIKLLESFVLQ
ncbi:TBC1D24_1 [Blepharisma stoltei]|uniref:TLDc domain-containing protein n=1 Tax=Blepharisma stoltei TaxID=1481888 RepID=A0AAU9IM76_9CILI|nr:unnamed protein product [Blepharisma stoltei]